MSASTERKNRMAAKQAGTDRKTNARLEAEQKAAKSRRRWTWGSVGVAVLLIVILLLNSGFVYKHTTAVKIGDRSYSPAELSYHYNTQYSSFLNNYGSYASLFGLDTSSGAEPLSKQACTMMGEGKTWRDYFLQGALDNLMQITALKHYADVNGITLDDDEIAEIDEQFASIGDMAKVYGYSSANNFLAAQYGEGVTVKLVRQLTLDNALASKALQQFSDSLDYSAERLEEYYASLEGGSDLFDFAYYYVAAEKLPVGEGESEDTIVLSVTDESRLEARMTAEAIEMAYKDGADIEDFTERFNAAIEAEDDTASATVRSSVSGSSLGDMGEWLKDASRKAGDLTVIEDSDGEGYYAVLFLSRDDNHYPTVSVRHILIRAAADENGEYTDEAKQAALDRINEIKAEYESGDRTEESFAELARQYSEDSGSSSDGGLYEEIYKGEMVTEFNDFCFAGHKSGDIGVVYGESSSYAGYHLIYFVSEGELYSDLIARSALSQADVNDFVSAQTEGFEPELRFWSKYVGD